MKKSKSILIAIGTGAIGVGTVLIGVVKGLIDYKKVDKEITLLERVEKTNADVAQAHKDIEEIEEVVPKLLDAKNAAEAEAEALKTELEAVKSQLEKAEAAKKAAENRADSKQKAIKKLEKQIEEMQTAEEIEEDLDMSPEYAENFTKIMDAPELDEPDVEEAQEKIKASDVVAPPKGKTAKAKKVRNGSVKSVPKGKNKSSKPHNKTIEVETAYTDGPIGEPMPVPNIKINKA